MTTWLITHPACLRHDTGPGHPESPQRLGSVLAALAAPEFALLERRQAPAASLEQLAQVHDRAYVERILQEIPAHGLRSLDEDTVVSPDSGEAALRAAGAACLAVDAVLTGMADRAFCAVRPPGHHAEAAQAMGFCLFNNIAVGAAHARAAHGARRIAVVDFDVHHGNGSEHMLCEQPGFLYLSTHEHPLYPNTGAGSSYNALNLPLRAGAGSEAFRSAYRERLLPALAAFRPELIMISAGFDAHRDDPLAHLELVEEDFGWVTACIVDIAHEHCGGRVVSTLEGGYDLEALGRSAAAHVRALL